MQLVILLIKLIMENLKQISVKIDPETLKKLDEIAIRAKYWKRNAIINSILTAIVDNCSYEDIMLLLQYVKYDPYSKPNIVIWKTKNQI